VLFLAKACNSRPSPTPYSSDKYDSLPVAKENLPNMRIRNQAYNVLEQSERSFNLIKIKSQK